MGLCEAGPWQVWPLAYQLARLAEAHSRHANKKESAVRAAAKKCYKVVQGLGPDAAPVLTSPDRFKEVEAAFATVRTRTLNTKP